MCEKILVLQLIYGNKVNLYGMDFNINENIGEGREGVGGNVLIDIGTAAAGVQLFLTRLLAAWIRQEVING